MKKVLRLSQPVGCSEPLMFEWLPDEEGIKTQVNCLLSFKFKFEWLPDEEGIKTKLSVPKYNPCKVRMVT